MGTAAYMSPEQIRGEKVDTRTDLFSFGVVLYETATGRQAFSGTTTAVVHDGILNRAPTPVTRLNPDLPPKLEEIISRALEKDRDLRYRSAGDLGAELRRLKRETDSVRHSAAKSRPLLRRVRFAVGGAALIVTAVLAFLFRPALPPPRITGSTQVSKDGIPKLGLVTDGSRIYFSSDEIVNSLYQVPAAGGETVHIQTPFLDPSVFDISPDRSKLLVGSCPTTPEDCQIYTLPVLGLSPQHLETHPESPPKNCPFQFRQASCGI
jgi:serine/threonine protein kinase